MIENGRLIGFGAAYVDAKIQSSTLHFPLERTQLPEFLDAHPEAELCAGGSIPNILTAFVRLSNNPNVRLLSCVGDDARGRFFAGQTDQRLGQPQVSTKNPTGIWVGIFDNNQLVEESDFYGAAGDITVSKKDIEDMGNGVLITDIDACGAPGGLNSVNRILEGIDSGLFILSLSGSHSSENINELLALLIKPPDVVFGNTFELSCITKRADLTGDIKSVFPASKLVVITQGEAGSMVRIREQISSVPPKYTPKDQVIDAAGAGDVFTGTMLASLFGTKHTNWSEQDVIRAARIGSYASALIIQAAQPRLTVDMAQSVLEYNPDK